MFYAEIPLFEDELHDNGASHLLTRVVSYRKQANALLLMHLPSACDADVFLHPVTLHPSRG